MVLAEASADTYIRWDAFLEAEAVREKVRPQDLDVFLRQRRRSIDAWREFEWPKVKVELAKDFHWEVPEGLEPHWTEAGSAVLWHEEIIKTPKVIGTSRSGAPLRVLEDVNYGWKPTSPQPINSASQLAHYLGNGFRLRPPQVEAAVLQSAVPADALQLPKLVPPPRKYLCERHGADEKRIFVTWKGYVQHCAERREVLEEEPPPMILAMAKRYQYYCLVHHRGWNSRRLAERHVKEELGKPGRAVHLSVEQLQMKPLEVKK